MDLRDFVHRCKMSYPDKVAYIDGDRHWTWSKVCDRSSQLASALQGLGIGKGRRRRNALL